jgi:hypothetical protein
LAARFCDLTGSFLLFATLILAIWPDDSCYLPRPFRLLAPQFRTTWVGHFAKSWLNGATQGFALEQAEKDQGCRLQMNLWKRRRKSCVQEINPRVFKMKVRD